MSKSKKNEWVQFGEEVRKKISNKKLEKQK